MVALILVCQIMPQRCQIHYAKKMPCPTSPVADFPSPVGVCQSPAAPPWGMISLSLNSIHLLCAVRHIPFCTKVTTVSQCIVLFRKRLQFFLNGPSLRAPPAADLQARGGAETDIIGCHRTGAQAAQAFCLEQNLIHLLTLWQFLDAVAVHFHLWQLWDPDCTFRYLPSALCGVSCPGPSVLPALWGHAELTAVSDPAPYPVALLALPTFCVASLFRRSDGSPFAHPCASRTLALCTDYVWPIVALVGSCAVSYALHAPPPAAPPPPPSQSIALFAVHVLQPYGGRFCTAQAQRNSERAFP